MSAGDVTVLEHFPSMHEALGLIPRTPKEEEKK
jgi:hypothetical protein